MVISEPFLFYNSKQIFFKLFRIAIKEVSVQAKFFCALYIVRVIVDEDGLLLVYASFFAKILKNIAIRLDIPTFGRENAFFKLGKNGHLLSVGAEIFGYV